MKRALLLVAVLLFAGLANAQNESKPADAQEYFRLDFALKDVEGTKVVNTRNYFSIVAVGSRENSSIRSGDKVPIPLTNGSFQYVDVGVNIDVRGIHRVGDSLNFSASVDLSGAVDVTDSPAATPRPGGPVIRQLRWSSDVTIPIKKSTVVFSSDGAAAKRQVLLDITATPITR